MTVKKIHTAIVYLMAFVWIANGLFCKVLNWAPRHEQIVGRILGEEFSSQIILTIGVLEIGMTVWILSRIKPKLNAITQIIIVALMNILEFFLADDLLLWGKTNAFFAFLFILLVYYQEFVLKRKIKN